LIIIGIFNSVWNYHMPFPDAVILVLIIYATIHAVEWAVEFLLRIIGLKRKLGFPSEVFLSLTLSVL